MRKLFWVLAGIMVLAAFGNIIGGTDTPVRVRSILRVDCRVRFKPVLRLARDGVCAGAADAAC